MKTIPLHITPSPEDIAAHERANIILAERLQLQAHRERAIVAGTASATMIERAIEEKALSRVLAGPVPLYNGKR